jgi:DoxX-like family
MGQIYQLTTRLTQLLLTAIFLTIPISRMLGAATLAQVHSLGAPDWLIWAANGVELTAAILLLAGWRVPIATALGAALITCSMSGATVLHIMAGNLFDEPPWTLVILGLSLALIAPELKRSHAALPHDPAAPADPGDPAAHPPVNQSEGLPH